MGPKHLLASAFGALREHNWHGITQFLFATVKAFKIPTLNIIEARMK